MLPPPPTQSAAFRPSWYAALQGTGHGGVGGRFSPCALELIVWWGYGPTLSPGVARGGGAEKRPVHSFPFCIFFLPPTPGREGVESEADIGAHS